MVSEVCQRQDFDRPPAARKAQSLKPEDETCRSKSGQDRTVKNAGYKSASTEKPITCSILMCVMTTEGVEEPAETDDFALPSRRLTTRSAKMTDVLQRVLELEITIAFVRRRG